MSRHPQTQLQLLAAATAINLKRLLSASQARTDTQVDHGRANHNVIAGLLDLLTRRLEELDHSATVATVERSTGS